MDVDAPRGVKRKADESLEEEAGPRRIQASTLSGHFPVKLA